jgi:hypothetical protein
VYESDGSAEDHKNLMEAMAKNLQTNTSQSTTPQSTPSPKRNDLKLLEVMDELFLLTKTVHKPATVIAYKFAIKEFSNLTCVDIQRV